MFMLLFRREAFAAAGGFDEGLFHVLRGRGPVPRACGRRLRVGVHPAAGAVHDARRASRRDLRHMRWHASSIARFLVKRWLHKA